MISPNFCKEELVEISFFRWVNIPQTICCCNRNSGLLNRVISQANDKLLRLLFVWKQNHIPFPSIALSFCDGLILKIVLKCVTFCGYNNAKNSLISTNFVKCFQEVMWRFVSALITYTTSTLTARLAVTVDHKQD